MTYQGGARALAAIQRPAYAVVVRGVWGADAVQLALGRHSSLFTIGVTHDWPFPDAPNFRAFTTRQVMERREPILAVYHDEDDGAWQFIGGAWAREDLIIVCLDHAVERDPSVRELADLPRGWGARREGEGEPWQRFAIPPEGEDDEDDEDDAPEPPPA